MTTTSKHDQLLNEYDDYLDATYSFENVGGVFSNMQPSAVLKTCDINLYNNSFNTWSNKQSQEKNRVLASASFVHTPGIFRAMQNDYQVGKHNKETRQKAVQLMHKTYGISTKEADGILSGNIPVTIDEDAGTVSYNYDVENDHA